jgi:hypothetical protein
MMRQHRQTKIERRTLDDISSHYRLLQKKISLVRPHNLQEKKKTPTSIEQSLNFLYCCFPLFPRRVPFAVSYDGVQSEEGLEEQL